MPDKAALQRNLFGIACSLTMIFPVLLPSATLCDIALSVIAAAFAGRSYMQKDWGWLKEGWVRVLLMLWTYMMVRGIFTPYPKDALSRALPFVRYIVFAAALARWTLAHEPTRSLFFKVLCCMVIFYALDGLFQYAAGYDIMDHRLIYDPNNRHIRLAGPFSKPILGIMLAWLAFPALLPGVFAPDGTFLRRGHSGVMLAACVAVIAAIALSGERMALLLTLMGLVLAGILLRLRLHLLLGVIAGIAVLLALLGFAAPDMFQRQVQSTKQTLDHWQESPYGMLLKSDLALAELHPLIGVGASHFRAACEALYAGDETNITNMCNTHPHNIYLEWLIEEGVFGLVLFLLFIGSILKGCIGVFMQKAATPAFAGLFIAFILRVWPFMSTTGFFSRWGAPSFWLVLGALLVYTAEKGEKNAGASLPLQDSGL